MKKSKNNHKIVNIVQHEIANSANWYKNKFFGDIIRPEDDILKDNGNDIKIYRSLLHDEQIKACYVNQRIAGVIATPWEVIPVSDSPVDKEIADFVQENLENLKFNDICRKMLYASWYGFQVGEILWDIQENRVVIKDIKVRRNERFVFGRNGELYLKDNYAHKELMPENKFWVLKNSADNDDDVYGVGLGHDCYWPVYLKRNGLKFWSVLVEKFAIPTAVGKYNPQASDDEIRRILEALDSIASETSIAVPEGTAVDLLEAYKSSGGDHEKFCCYLDKIIAKAILGQDGTSQNGAYVGTAEVHEDVKTLILKADADLLCESFNQVIQWLVSLNFPDAEAPAIVRRFEKAENQKDEAEIYQMMHGVGYRPSLQQVVDKFGGDWEKVDSFSETPPQTPVDYSEPALIPSHFFDNAEWEKIMPEIIAPVEKIFENSQGFDDLEKKLLKAYPEMDVSKLQELLAEATFKARLNGAAGVKNE